MSQELHASIFHLLVQSNEDPGAVIADAIMAMVDFHGQNPRASVDRRAWEHALIYAPKDLKGDEAKSEARVKELEAVVHAAHGYSQIALEILRNRPWPTPNAEAYMPLEKALAEVLAATKPKGTMSPAMDECPKCKSKITEPEDGSSPVCPGCGMLLTRAPDGRWTRSIFDDLDE